MLWLCLRFCVHRPAPPNEFREPGRQTRAAEEKMSENSSVGFWQRWRSDDALVVNVSDETYACFCFPFISISQHDNYKGGFRTLRTK